ncbi:MAG: endonuclease III [Pseudomonadota bacterium]
MVATRKDGKKATPAQSAAAKTSRNGTKKPAKRKRHAPTKLKPHEIVEMFEAFRSAEPEPVGELEHVNPYTLVVAVALSAQSTDAGVNKATRALFAKADTPEKMLALGQDGVREHIKSIGLFRNKAKNVIALSKRLVEEYGGEVPRDRDALETLPGVGRKTANVVMNIAFGEPFIAVDTHIFRVSNRTGLAPGKDPLAVELNLERLVPQDYQLHCHHWLILHGRYVCLARKPRCPDCLIAEWCRYKDKIPAPMS